MLPVNKYTFTLSANGSYRLLASGEYFKILACTGGVTVAADWGKLESLIAGQGLEKSPFQYLFFTDTSGAGNTITVLVGDENFIDGFVGNVAITAGKVAQSSSFSNVVATVTNASAQLVAANTNRQALEIYNKSLTGTIYLNFGAAATVANGIPVAPGASYVIPNAVSTQIVNAIGDIASNTQVLVMQG